MAGTRATAYIVPQGHMTDSRPHPHQPLVFPRKVIGSTKRMEWGDPARLERIHQTLRKAYVTNTKPQAFKQCFLKLDKDYPNTLSVRGFNSLLVNSGVHLSQEDAEQLFAFYDSEGHGSMDANDFLIGLRYNLAMDKVESERVNAKISHVRAKRTEDVVNLLRKSGLSREQVTESAFVKSMKTLVGTACSTSELLFLFSTLSGNDRLATVPLDEVAGLLVAREAKGPLIDVHALQERLGTIIYDPLSPVGGRVGLNRVLSRGDKDFDGSLNRREFECIKSIVNFTDAEVDALFRHYDPGNRGTIYFDDLVQQYRPQAFLPVTEKDLAAINEVAVRHIRHRSPGYPGVHRTYRRYLEQAFERHDPKGTGFFNLTRFFRVMEDLAGGDLKDLEIELLFEHWAQGGQVDWRRFLRVLLGEESRDAEKARLTNLKIQDESLAWELRERLATVITDRDRQTGGAQGFLRIERLFDRFDQNRDGQLTVEEFRRALRALGGLPFDDDDLTVIFNSFDNDNSGSISHTEFIEGMQAILAKRARDKWEAGFIPYPYEEIPVLERAVAEGAIHRRFGVQGLLVAFGKFDRDGDGRVDLRAFGTVVRSVCVPCPSEENISHLFRHHDPQGTGKVLYADFVDSLGIDRLYHPTQEETRQAFAKLATLFVQLTQSGRTTVSRIQRLFQQHSRTTPGFLTLSELLRALRALGYDGPALDVECVYRHFRPSQGLTFEQFDSVLKGTGLRPGLDTPEGLLQRLHCEVYDDNHLSTMGVARLLNRQDECKAGVVDFKGLCQALKGAGSSMTFEEMKHLFKSFGPDRHHNGINIREFLERLRLCRIQDTPEDQIRQILNILGSSVEFRNQGLRGWTSRFEAHDPAGTGTVDFVGFMKAVDCVESQKLSDHEKERLFHRYSPDKMRLPYGPLVTDVLYRPLNRGHEYFGDSLCRDPMRHKLEPLLLDAQLPRPPLALLEDAGVLPRLLQTVYSPVPVPGMGSLRLAHYFLVCRKGGTHLKLRDFVAAVQGLGRPATPVPEAEAVALYEQLRDGEKGVDMEALLRLCREQHTVCLSPEHFKQIMDRLRDHMWDNGKRDFDSTRSLFRSVVRPDDFLDLHAFTLLMKRACGGLLTDIELELLFNEFSEDRWRIDVDAFARALVPPMRPRPAPIPGPSPNDVQRAIDKAVAHIYNPRRKNSGTLALLKAIRQADRDRDDLLSRQEFLELFHLLEVALVCTHAELNAIFDSIAVGAGHFAQAAVKDVLRLIRGSPLRVRPTMLEFQALLHRVRAHLAYAVRDPALLRLFERHDPKQTRLLGLGPFTTAVFGMMNADADLTPLEVEALFDFLDKERVELVNYLELLECLATLPPLKKEKAEPSMRVWDSVRRADIQSAEVASPRAHCPPLPAELEPGVSPFLPTDHMLYVQQGGMANWHRTVGAPPGPAGGAPSNAAREALYRKGRGMWVPGPKEQADWTETNQRSPPPHPSSPKYQHYIAACGDRASEVSHVSSIPPYVTEAASLGEWLDVLGLAKYQPLLESHEVDLQTLSELQAADLEGMGLPVGPRLKLLKAARLMH